MTDARMTLSTKIIQRFLKGKDFDDFMGFYDSNKQVYSLADRKSSFEADITPEEQKAMDAYYGNFDKSVKNLAKEQGLTQYKFERLVEKGSKKFVYKNR